MAIKPGNRASNQRYIDKHYSSVTCKLPKHVAEQFKAMCAESGMTPNAVIKGLIAQYMGSPIETTATIKNRQMVEKLKESGTPLEMRVVVTTNVLYEYTGDPESRIESTRTALIECGYADQVDELIKFVK